ncbi:hypothetical protein [Desulfurispora thermophila]|uniref:hypothetical protein n=1 Tax=Desulfurispora thermophila TaxID=265470 RepID=UPI0012EA3462|nr:hypothetical protein [Desulfurispora thermophila]
MRRKKSDNVLDGDFFAASTFHLDKFPPVNKNTTKMPVGPAPLGALSTGCARANYPAGLFLA